MKKCKWCNSDIEDDVTVCPYCKASQNNVTAQNQTNHFEKYSNSNVSKRTTKHTTSFNNGSKEDTFFNDVHQIAGDLRFIKNLIIICLILSIIFGFIGGLSLL